VSSSITVPLWLALVVALLAILALLDRLLMPSARWFIRSRANKVLDEVSQRAVALEPDWPIVWDTRSAALMRLRRWDAALEASRRFMRLDPYNPRALNQHAELLVERGQPADALPFAERSLAMGTRRGHTGALVAACHAHLLLDASQKAVSACEKARLDDDLFTHTLLVAAYANSGDGAQARTALATLLQIVPTLTVSMARSKGASDHPEYLKLADRTLYAGLRKAGLKD